MGDFEANESQADISSLLEVNRLDFRLPPSLSIATSRSMKVYRSQQSSYIAGGQQLQFTLSSGSTYVDFMNSFLKFTVKLPDVIGAAVKPKMPPHCGWANMIQQIRIVHSSGVELDRINTGVGEWLQIMNYYDRSADTRKVVGGLYDLNDTSRPSPLVNSNSALARAKEGLNVPYDAAAYHGDSMLTGAGQVMDISFRPEGKEFPVCIPLSQLLGFFNVDLLAPSFLSAGLQIHIDMYSPEHFFVCGTDNRGNYTGANGWPSADGDVKIVNPEMHLETFTLTDSIVRKLSQISASSGLEWYFDAVHTMSGGGSEGDYSMQISRALSRANNVIVKTRTKSYIGDTFRDSFGSQPWVLPVNEGGGTSTNDLSTGDATINGAMNNFQVQLGAQYIPSKSLSQKKEFIHSALKTFSQFRRSDEIGGPDDTQFSGFRTTRNTVKETPNKYMHGLAISAVPLESSSTLQQSGAAISAQRTAVVNMGWVGGGGTARQVDCFVVYSKLATLFLDSVVVRS